MARPDLIFTRGKSQEEKKEIERQWNNMRWFTDPIKNEFLRLEKETTDNLIDNTGTDSDEQKKADIRAYRKLLKYFP